MGTGAKTRVTGIFLRLERLKVSKDEVAAVGDTVVDIPLFERAGLGIAVNTNDQRLIDEADYHLKEKNLRKLIPIITSG